MPGSDARAAAGEEEGFRCEIGWAAPRVLMVEYGGRVPAADRHLRQTERIALAAARPIGLCYDITSLVSFDRAQVPMHGRMLAAIAPRVAGIALVGARPAAHFGAVTVSLLSRIHLRSFERRRDALSWLESILAS